MSARARRGLVLCAIAIAGCACLWLGVRWVISLVADQMLREQGLACDPVDVSFAWDLSSASLGPTRCELEGRVRAVRLPAGLRADLDGRRVTRVASADVELQIDSAIPEVGAAALLERDDVPVPLQHMLDDLARLSARADLPAIGVERVLVTGGGQALTLRDLSVVRSPSELVVRVASIAPPAIERRRLSIHVGLAALEAHATRSAARMSGRAALDAELGAQEIDESVGIEVSGTGLGGPTPRYTLTIERSPRLDALREQLRNAPERAAQRRERVHELSERLRQRAEGMSP